MADSVYGSLHIALLIRLGIAPQSAAEGDANALRMLEISVASSSASVDESGRFQVFDQLSNFRRHSANGTTMVLSEQRSRSGRGIVKKVGVGQ